MWLDVTLTGRDLIWNNYRKKLWEIQNSATKKCLCLGCNLLILNGCPFRTPTCFPSIGWTKVSCLRMLTWWSAVKVSIQSLQRCANIGWEVIEWSIEYHWMCLDIFLVLMSFFGCRFFVEHLRIHPRDAQGRSYSKAPKWQAPALHAKLTSKAYFTWLRYDSDRAPGWTCINFYSIFSNVWSHLVDFCWLDAKEL